MIKINESLVQLQNLTELTLDLKGGMSLGDSQMISLGESLALLPNLQQLTFGFAECLTTEHGMIKVIESLTRLTGLTHFSWMLMVVSRLT